MAEPTDVAKVVTAEIVQGDEAPPLTEKQFEWAVVTQDFMALTQQQREYVRLRICQREGYDPLTNAVMFIPDGKGGLKLYAGAAAAKSKKDKLKITLVPIYAGPLCTMTWRNGELEIGAVCEPRLFVTIWKATSEGMGDTYDGSAMALAPEVTPLENSFKKLLTQVTNRTIFRHAGNPFMDATEAGDMDKGFGPPAAAVAAPQAKQRVPAPKPQAQIAATPVEVTEAQIGVPVQAKGPDVMAGVELAPAAPVTAFVPTGQQAQAPPPPPAAPRGVPQTGAGPVAFPGPRALPKSPLPAAKPPKVGG